MKDLNNKIKEAATILRNSKHTTVFTGAGISVESGIPSFRGENGLWTKYNPQFAEINYFKNNPKESWILIKEVFYDFFGQAKPNQAHITIARLEKNNIVKAIITQNIDNLHQEAGSQVVYEFHGTAHYLRCMACNQRHLAQEIKLDNLPPLCPVCEGLLKPDMIFFGEGIPQEAYIKSFAEAETADVFLVVGTTGEVMPACQIPVLAKQKGAKIIEINTVESHYTYHTTDIFLQGKAGEILPKIESELFS